MAETSKKVAKTSSTKKPATKKTSTTKTASTKKETKAEVKKTSTVKKAVKEVKPVTVAEETKAKEVKEKITPVVAKEKKENDILSYIKTIPTKVKENSILVIITIVVGVLVGMGVLALLGFRRIPKLNNGDEVVVSLKGNNITANDLYEDLKNSYGLTLLLDQIDKLILEAQYPDTDEITKYIDSQVEYLKTTYGDQFEDYIKYYGFDSEEKVREYFSLNYKRNLALLDYAKGLITDDEIKKYYDEKVFGDIEASHILIKFNSSDSDSKQKALEKANTVINELNNASDVAARFKELASEYSDDTTNKDNGGSLGYFGTGEMEESFENAAKALENGKYTTTPVETSYGYHIILKTNQKEKTSLDEMKDSITEKLAENLLTSNTETQYKALENIRKENKVTFKDAELREKYNTYLSELYSSLDKKSK